MVTMFLPCVVIPTGRCVLRTAMDDSLGVVYPSLQHSYFTLGSTHRKRTPPTSKF